MFHINQNGLKKLNLITIKKYCSYSQWSSVIYTSKRGRRKCEHKHTDKLVSISFSLATFFLHLNGGYNEDEKTNFSKVNLYSTFE